jgi:hypothetical protein
VPRSGDEPDTARSALGLRATLAGFGLACGLAGVVLFAALGPTWAAAAFGLLGLIAAADLGVVVHHIRQGAHYQPGRAIPPYHPVRPERAGRALRTGRPSSGSEPSPERRLRLYLALMGTCLGLLVLAWTWVRLFSTGLAVAMTVVAMVIPPVAAILANLGAMPPPGGGPRDPGHG